MREQLWQIPDRYRSPKKGAGRWLRLSLAAVLAISLLPIPSLLAQNAGPPASPEDAQLRDLMTRFGLRPISPPSPATDLRLPYLDGGEGSLSDFQGQWVVLTFFATWCGPCRSEMPSLEKLHRQRKDAGVAVVGVSIDSSTTPLEPFLNQYLITFPILWDSQGRAASVYRASSIPLTYLVDPRGRLVAMSRGARDWWQLAGMMDEALAILPPGQGDAEYATVADSSGPVELPEILDPPTAEVRLAGAKPSAGETFFLDIQLQWAGNFEEYLPHPPEVLLPEGVVQENVTAATDSRQGSNRVTYRVALKAEEAGSYALDPIELRYTPRFEAQPQASRVTGPTVEVQPRKIAGMTPATLALVTAVGVGGSALASLAVFGLIFLRKRRAGPARSADAELYERLKNLFEEARHKRLQGDAAACFERLVRIHDELRESNGEDAETGESAADRSLARAAEAARYGGVVPPLAELDSFQRTVERRLEALRPDEGKKRRQSIRLKDDDDR